MCAKSLQLCLTFCSLWTVAHQAPLSTGFSRQEYRSRFPCPPPGDLLNPGIEPMSLMSLALAGGFFTPSATWEVCMYIYVNKNSLLSTTLMLTLVWVLNYANILHIRLWFGYLCNPCGFNYQAFFCAWKILAKRSDLFCFLKF